MKVLAYGSTMARKLYTSTSFIERMDFHKEDMEISAVLEF